MIRRTLYLLFALAVAFSGAAITSAAAPTQAAGHQVSQRGGDRDCSDFATQAAAQRFFLNNGGPRRDPHRLDSDGDGIACESNPCPCNHSTGGGGGDGGGTPPNPGPTTLRQKARVIRVIDGDTVKVKLKDGPRRDVRIIGIDTPEVFGGEECGGRPASRSARQFLPKGTLVTLISDPTQALKDRYDRLLRYIHKRSGFDVGRGQLRRGWAKVYVYNNDPFKRTRSYKRTQAEARTTNRGIWGLC